MNQKLKFALGCSGEGRGIKNLILNKSKLNHDISLIICPNKSIELINIAKENQIPIEYLENNNSVDQKNSFIFNKLKAFNIDYFFLIGLNFKIKEKILNNYINRVINIHPSILPSFKGLNAIQQAINYGVMYSGITIHYANKEYDSGQILNQIPIRIDNLTFKQIDQIFVSEGLELSIETINKI